MRVLAVGAHPDDIEIGCGATLLAHRARGDEISMLVMTGGESGPQDRLSRIAEQEAAAAMLDAALLWGRFADGQVPDDRRAVQVVEDVVSVVEPDIVYVHSPGDTHQDHRATATAVLSAARRLARVLLYESPSTTEFHPTLYVDVHHHLAGKLELLRAHASQVRLNGLVDLDALEAQARYRGFRARITYAEAFEPSRFVWDLETTSAPVELTAEALLERRTA